MDTNQFKNFVKDILIANSFKKIGSKFFLESNEILCVVSLQRSYYSNSYYINIDYYFRDLLENPNKPDDFCHLFSRMHDEKCKGIYELELIDEQYMSEVIHQNLNNQIIPCMTIDGIKNQIKKNPVLKNMIPLKVKPFLNLE